MDQPMTEDQFKIILSKFEQIDQRFEHIDAKFGQIDAKFVQIDRRFEQIDQRFEHLDRKMNFIIGIYIAGIIAILSGVGIYTNIILMTHTLS